MGHDVRVLERGQRRIGNRRRFDGVAFYLCAPMKSSAGYVNASSDAGEETVHEVETIVFGKQPDGRWLIVHQHLSPTSVCFAHG